jgi:hypothetical protein
LTARLSHVHRGESIQSSYLTEVRQRFGLHELRKVAKIFPGAVVRSMCRTYGARDSVCGVFSHRFRGGLAYAAPTALVRHGRSKKRWERSRRDFGAPQVRHMRCSAEREFPVEWDAVFFQEREKFRVEGDFFVMGVLILDVADYGGDLRGAYAEGGVAFLPSEFVFLSMGPARGIRFDGEDGLG